MEAGEIRFQLEMLGKDLDRYKSDQIVEWRVGKVANALIEEARAALPGNPVLEAIEPFTPTVRQGGYVAKAKAADVTAIVRQAATVLPVSVPKFAVV